MLDRDGRELTKGDVVMLPCVIVNVTPSLVDGAALTLGLKSLHARDAEGTLHTYHTVNARQVRLSTPAADVETAYRELGGEG